MTIAAEKWIDLFRLYGPMALFVFMVFILLRIARAGTGLSPVQKKVQVAAYSMVWLSIFALAAMIVIVWWRNNFPGEFVVVGQLHTLTYREIVTTDEELFLHRHTKAGLDFEYEWRFISHKQFVGSVELLLQKHPQDVNSLKYKLPIRKSFGAWSGGRRKIDKRSFSTQLARLDKKLYEEMILTNQNSHQYELDGKHYLIEVGTHYVKAFANIFWCPGLGLSIEQGVN
jgi:hypothetical protein